MKSNFQTYNHKRQHLNIEARSFPLLMKYLDALNTSSYQHEPFEPTDEGVRDVVKKSINDFFGKPYSEIKLPYIEFKPLADEYAKVIKLSGEPNYIPVIIRSNGYKISISPE